MLEDMFQVELLPLTEVALLVKQLPCLTRKQTKLAVLLLAAAQQVVAKAWWMPALNLKEVKLRMSKYMAHAKMTAIIKDCMSLFEGIWEPWNGRLLT